MSNSMIPKLLLDRGVHSGPAGLLLSSEWISSGGPTVETLCASSIGLERDEGARVFSPYFSNLPSDNLSNRSEASMNHQSIFSMVVMISPRTASTPIRQSLRRALGADLRVFPVSLHATRHIASISLNTHALRLLKTSFLWANVVCLQAGCARCARLICS